jgi:hypothetical protein
LGVRWKFNHSAQNAVSLVQRCLWRLVVKHMRRTILPLLFLILACGLCTVAAEHPVRPDKMPTVRSVTTTTTQDATSAPWEVVRISRICSNAKTPSSPFRLWQEPLANYALCDQGGSCWVSFPYNTLRNFA